MAQGGRFNAEKPAGTRSDVDMLRTTAFLACDAEHGVVPANRQRELKVARPDPPGPCSKRSCSGDSVRFEDPGPRGCGTWGYSLSCGAGQEILRRELWHEPWHCGARPSRSESRPTYFPNLWPCFHSTPVEPKWEGPVQFSVLYANLLVCSVAPLSCCLACFAPRRRCVRRPFRCWRT